MIKPNSLKLLIKCIEDGIESGFQREEEYKVVDLRRLQDTLQTEIVRELSEWFTADGEEIEG